MIKRAPNDPAWYRGGLWHDNMPINIPGFWFMSWYDVSVGPNLAAYNHVRKTAKAEVANQQYAVIAPTLHCSFARATEDTIVGERSMGDARLDYKELTYGWFDHFLKGENNGVLEKMPKVNAHSDFSVSAIPSSSPRPWKIPRAAAIFASPRSETHLPEYAALVFSASRANA